MNTERSPATHSPMIGHVRELIAKMRAQEASQVSSRRATARQEQIGAAATSQVETEQIPTSEKQN